MSRPRDIMLPGQRPVFGAHHLYNDLLLWLPTNEKAGSNLNNIIDALNNAVLTGGTWVGNGVQLDATDDEITARRVLLDNDWTAILHYTPAGVSGISPILDQGDILIRQSDDDIIYGVTDTLYTDYTGTVSAILTAGEPVDIAVTRQGTTIAMYANGTLQGSFTASGTALTALTNLVVGSDSRTAFVYPALTPAALTGENGILINANDDLQYSVGSASLNDPAIAEHINTAQGTLEFWVKPNWDGDDGLIHNIFSYRPTGGTIYDLRKNSDDTLDGFAFVGTYRRIQTDVSSWQAGDWHHVVMRWDADTVVSGSNYIDMWIDGVQDLTGTTPTSSWTPVAGAAVPIAIGQQSGTFTDKFNGTIYGRILSRVLSATEITALYASGAGHLDSTVVTDDVLWMGAYKDGVTTTVYSSIGKSVSASSNSGTETTLTTAAGSDTVFADGDRVKLSDATGYGVFGLVDGTPGSTSVLVDDGAGALVTDAEKVGVAVDFDGTHYITGGNVLNVSTNDFSLSAIVQTDDTTNESGYYRRIISKEFGTPANGYGLELNLGVPTIAISNAHYEPSGAASIADGVAHHVCVTADRSGNAALYVDGVLVGTVDVSGKVAVDLDNTSLFTIGKYAPNDNGRLNGNVSDVKILTNGLWSAAQILYQATHPHDVSASAGTLTDYWHMDEGTGSTINGFANNLTLSNAAAWSLEAHLSHNLALDPNNGGIGGIGAMATTWTATKDTTVVLADSQSLKLVNAAGNDNDEVEIDAWTLAASVDMQYSFDFYVTALAGASDIFIDIDGSATPIHTRQLNTGTDDRGVAYATGTWLHYEGCFQADQAAIVPKIRITGAGAGANSATIFIDKMVVKTNMAANPGMEGGADPPASWTQEASATVVSDTSPHSGTNCLKVTAGAANVGASQAITLVSGAYYTGTGWAKATAADTAEITIDTGDGTTISAGTVTATSWTKIEATFLATGTSGVIYLRGVANGDVVWFDDITLTRNATRAASTADRLRSFADGKVESVAVWNRALSAEEVQEWHVERG